jgi:hypothetical protein
VGWRGGGNAVEIDLLRGGELTVRVEGTGYGPLIAGKGGAWLSRNPSRKGAFQISLGQRPRKWIESEMIAL